MKKEKRKVEQKLSCVSQPALANFQGSNIMRNHLILYLLSYIRRYKKLEKIEHEIMMFRFTIIQHSRFFYAHQY